MSALDRYHAHTLSTFLKGFTTPSSKGQDASLCGMGSVKGRWFIPDSKYDEFHDHLADYLFKEKGRPLNLVEQPRLDSAKPILIDLDFKFGIDSGLSHRFNNKQIEKFVGHVAEGLGKFFDTSVYEAIRFFVSLRPQAYADGKRVKDGIHIQSPDICLTNEKQKVLRLWLLEKEAIQDSFENIGYVNEIDDIYDESMVRKQGWFPYGESKPNIPPYALETVLRYNPENQTISEDSEEFSPRDLLKLLSVRYNVSEDDNEIRDKELFDKYARAPPPRTAPAAGGTVAPATAQVVSSQLSTLLNVHIPDTYDYEEVELSKRITLECLSKKRADTYKTWMEVGWCLSNIDGGEEMFDTWKEFSKKSDKSDNTDWAKLKRDWMRGLSRNTAGSKLTLKSLHYWARDDNLEIYKEIVEEDHIRYAQYRVDDTHYHVAKLLYRMYKGRFCASVESRRTEWFVFDEKIHTWRHTNQGMELQGKLSTEVADLVVRARMRLKKQGEEAFEKHKTEREGHMTETLPSKANNKGDDFMGWFSQTNDGESFMRLTKVEKNLYKQEFKGSVMRAAVEIFHEEDFANRLNMNPNLFACKNGVLDLRNEITDASGAKHLQVIFRDGRPDDYISNLAGRNSPDSDAIDYIPYDPNSHELKELMGFLRKIFPKPEMLAFYIRLMASCLEGMNREQCYYTFIGVGGNGKSKVVDLMRFTFGDYCSSLAATALTRKRPDSGAANPDIIAIKNKRFIYLQEPDDREPLNTSRMKQFSGEDVVEARGLFEDQQRFRITGKLFMMCNRLPPIHAMDRGTWRRIRVILFGSKFVDSSDPELKANRTDVFLRDNGLDSKLREWREVWLGLLVHVFEKEYLVNGLEPIPSMVMEESNKYKESFDQYGKFKAERIVDFRDVRAGLQEFGNEEASLKDMNMAYTKWIQQNDGVLTGKKLTRQELQNRLEEDFGVGAVFKRCAVFFDDDGKADFVRERAQP